ncbi:MAG: tetratricopeptide repeat protein [Moraxellaceae bacterium]|nr:tetratricopeptide repeat protein [Moraxellaceae bacterium]
MYKFTASVLCFAICQASFAAGIVIEEKSLSKSPTPEPVAAPVINVESTPTMQWQLFQKVQQLQQELRELNGALEVQANIIERMKQDARNRYLDLDQRITELKNRPIAVADSNTPNNTATSSPAATASTETSTTPVVATPPVVNPDDDKKAYFAAYQTFKTGGPNKAINPMRNFIKTYPQSSYISSAYYWLGEFYLAASPADVNNAKKSFKIVTDNYADAPKAAAALLKLASFADVDGKTTEAIKYMQRIIKEFPQSDEAKAAKAYLTSQNIALPDDKNKAKTSPNKKPVKKEEKTKATP